MGFIIKPDVLVNYLSSSSMIADQILAKKFGHGIKEMKNSSTEFIHQPTANEECIKVNLNHDLFSKIKQVDNLSIQKKRKYKV